MHGSSLLRIIQAGFKSLRLHKLRSMLTMLGMIIGVWAVITLVAIGEGASYDAQEEIKALGTNNVIIRSVKPETDKVQLQGEMQWVSYYGLTNADAARILKTVPGVKRVLPILRHRKNALHGKRSVDCLLIGTHPHYPSFTQSRMLVGQFLNEMEEARGENSCVLSHDLAKKLFAGENPLQENITVRGFESWQVFRVKGILEERTDLRDLEGLPPIYIPLSTFKDLYGVKNVDLSVGSVSSEVVHLHQIRVEFKNAEEVIPSIDLIKDALNKGRNGKIDYEIKVPLDKLNALRATKARHTLLLMSVACISLLVGGIGIMNIMLATVTERTREIGVRRALGATQGDITLQFLVETLMLCLIGGGVGVIGGWLFATFRHNIMNTTTIVTEWSVALAFGLSVFVGLIFGIYPARRAARLDPIEALRHA